MSSPQRQFQLERSFGFRVGCMLGDGFVNAGALHLDFRSMRVRLDT